MIHHGRLKYGYTTTKESLTEERIRTVPTLRHGDSTKRLSCVSTETQAYRKLQIFYPRARAAQKEMNTQETSDEMVGDSVNYHFMMKTDGGRNGIGISRSSKTSQV
ncbi:hypothetical protein Cob_v006044 [Colletotrichum orbiculare MAFF 240422]|uniref:Uncharacterized protein n=1 Tax=Colletotrichum orbiculare (strain 104-T / ATCC 96160 / CBS 514.97 / LARS 414 / MAFF 240422) TaxID=1213857 RepID=A0A484FTU0_COLOR|nr:hypothetical protein Cob_v006044 [Colletotrichum orbiculare MAFF 240422]